MERDIKPTYDELESYVENLQKQLADAQATIAALQAQVKELEQWVQDQSTANLETMRHMDEMQSRAMDAEYQLTRRTAELEAVNKHCEIIEERKAEAYKEVEIQLLAKANLQAELERVRADNKALDEWRADVTVSLQRPGGAFFVDVPQHIKDLVKERDDLRTLIAALPKVEEEIAVKRTEVDLSDVWGITLNGYFTFQSALFDGKEEAEAYAAILKHRQGMEG